MTNLLILFLKNYLYFADSVDKNRLTKVTGMYKGHLVEMKQSGCLWGPAEWKELAGPQGISTGCFYPPLIFQFFVIHKSPPKFQGNIVHISKMLDDPKFIDVKIIVKGKTFGAHLAILASASPVMAATFKSGKFKEGATKSMRIDDMEPQVFEQILRHLYATAMPRLNEFAEQLLEAADKYQIDSLKRECEVYLSSNLTFENVIDRFFLAQTFSFFVVSKVARANY
jgi:hypothetical protein